MNVRNKIAGYLLTLAAFTFWVSWVLMPEPGTTDTTGILTMVREVRSTVFISVIVQIISSLCYITSFMMLSNSGSLHSKTAVTGLILSGIGVLGLCADAFFHLLAFFMTSRSVTLNADIIRVMVFMQTEGVAVLVPLLLCFFAGSIILARGLRKQGLISKWPGAIMTISILTGVVAAFISINLWGYKGPALSLSILGLFSLGQALLSFDLIESPERPAREISKSTYYQQYT